MNHTTVFLFGAGCEMKIWDTTELWAGICGVEDQKELVKRYDLITEGISGAEGETKVPNTELEIENFEHGLAIIYWTLMNQVSRQDVNVLLDNESEQGAGAEDGLTDSVLERLQKGYVAIPLAIRWPIPFIRFDSRKS